jgi:diguanylate cyclase
MVHIRQWRPRLACAFALWLCLLAPASAQALNVELLLTDGAIDGPPVAAPVLARAEAAAPGDTAELNLPRRGGHYWLRLTSDRAFEADEQPLLVLDGSGQLGTVAFHPPGAPPRQVSGARAGGSPLLRRGWALPLPGGWPAASVAYLQVDGASTAPLRLRLTTVPALVHEQRNGTRASTAAVTTLLLGAIGVFVLWLLFRDLVYLTYAGYLVCVALYATVLTGDAGEIPGLGWLARGGPTVHWTFSTFAVVLQLVFTARFLELDRVLPRAARLLRAVAWLHVGLLAMLWLGRGRVHEAYYVVGNLLLVAGVPMLLTVALLARRRGAAYGGVYLVGWTPMLLVASAACAHQLGWLQAPWAGAALPATAVVEALALVAVLAHHGLARHRLALAEDDALVRDPMTGALDGASLRRILAAWYRRANFGRTGYGLLMLEVDCHGESAARAPHVHGHAVLQQVLRRLRTLLRADDSIARIDGARFAIVSECRRQDCEQLVERVEAGFAGRPLRIDGRSVTVSLDVGLVMSRRGEPVDALFARAGQALDQARERRLLRTVLEAAHAAGAARPLADA